MNGNQLNVYRIRKLVEGYIQDPVRYLRDLLAELQSDSTSPVEEQLALINPECWMNFPQIITWRNEHNITNKRKAVQIMLGQIGWSRHAATSCECGQAGNQCGGVTNDNLVMDHWYPVSEGGPFWSSNLKMLAPYCNTAKSSDFGNFVGDADVTPWVAETMNILYNDFVSKGMY